MDETGSSCIVKLWSFIGKPENCWTRYREFQPAFKGTVFNQFLIAEYFWLAFSDGKTPMRKLLCRQEKTAFKKSILFDWTKATQTEKSETTACDFTCNPDYAANILGPNLTKMHILVQMCSNVSWTDEPIAKTCLTTLWLIQLSIW